MSAVAHSARGRIRSGWCDAFFRFIPKSWDLTTAVWNTLKLNLFALPRAGGFIKKKRLQHAGSHLDRLFLQCFERRGRPQRRQRFGRRSAAYGAPDLRLPWLQRGMRPLRPHHQQDHQGFLGCVRQGVRGRMRSRASWRAASRCRPAGEPGIGRLNRCRNWLKFSARPPRH